MSRQEPTASRKFGRFGALQNSFDVVSPQGSGRECFTKSNRMAIACASGAMANPVRPIILGATACFARIELISHGSPARGRAADVVVLPLHTRY
jgi:hypothetical protein